MSRPFRMPWVLLALPLLAAAPAGDSARHRQIESWLIGLADADFAVRDSARRALMELPPYELSVVREIATARLLRPAQADALRDVVVHVLSHAAGQAVPLHGTPYVGVRPRQPDDPPVKDSDGNGTPPIGEVVDEVLPGTPAERTLLAGDVLLGADECSGDTLQTVWFDRNHSLADRVSGSAPGEVITFHVRRAGRVLRIAVTPEPRPLPIKLVGEDDAVALKAVMDDARVNAMRVFDEQFGPLMRPMH